MPTQPDTEELALFEGGPQIKIVICSANIGNKMIQSLDDWVPNQPEHTDLVVVGMQEATYRVKQEHELDDDETYESDVSLEREGHSAPQLRTPFPLAHLQAV